MNSQTYINTVRVLLIQLMVLACVTFSLSCRNCMSGWKGSTREPALHAVHNEQLREIMTQLGELTQPGMPQELDEGGQGFASLGEVQDAAKSLAEASAAIAMVADELDLTDEEGTTFLALADRLAQEAIQVRDHARRGHARDARRAMQAMSATCVACHGLFRSSPL